MRGFDHKRWTATRKAHHTPRTALEIGRSDGAPSLVYQPAKNCWSLWWPCGACSGAKLPLRTGANVDGTNRIHLPLARGLSDQPCPGCEARHKRAQPSGLEPAVWYDPVVVDWVVRLPCHGLHGGALLPLEIRWFDAPWAEVYRAACDIAYGGDAFDGVLG